MADFTIRRATTDDLAAIGRLGASLVAEHHGFDAKRFLAPLPDIDRRYAEFIGRQLDKPDVVVLVAERDGTVLGYAYAGLEGPDFMALRGPAGAIYDLIVTGGARRRGVATALLNAVFDALSAQGAPRVVLSTAQKNEVAQSLFERVGFRRTMIEMTRELDPRES